MLTPSHCWPHQQRPSASMMQVPLPQQRSSSIFHPFSKQPLFSDYAHILRGFVHARGHRPIPSRGEIQTTDPQEQMRWCDAYTSCNLIDCNLLDYVCEPQELAIPGMFLHPLKGDRKGQCAMTVSGFGPMGIGPAQYLSFHQDAGTRLDTAFVLTSPGPLVPAPLRIHLSSL